MKKIHPNSAYSLVEVLIAVSILLLAVAGPMTIAHKGLQSSYFARDQLTAFALAQEGIETFTALRNEVVLEQLNESNIGNVPDFDKDTLWAWTAQPELNPCFSSAGCNIDFDDEDPLDNVRSCSTISNCLLDYDKSAGARARFVVNDGTDADDSPYTRVIRLNELETDQEIQIEVTVSWEPTIFGSGTKEVVLLTSILNLYANP